MKKCIICGQMKPLESYYTYKEMADGHLNKCKECCKAYARARDTKNYDWWRHHYNPSRYLQHRYNAIKSRCEGRVKSCSRYAGKEYCSKEEWEQWCKETYPTFLSLYENWQAQGFKRKYAPSIDRIDNSKGYVPGNMQWLTLSQNSKKGIKIWKRL